MIINNNFSPKTNPYTNNINSHTKPPKISFGDGNTFVRQERRTDTMYDKPYEETWYLSKIYQIPMLTPEEEQKIYEQINAGRYAEEISKNKLDVQIGKEAQKKLVKSYLRTVPGIAGQMSSKYPTLKFDDAIQAGNLGLMKAAKLYDYTISVPFRTFSKHYVRNSIIDTIYNKTREIILPNHINNRISAFKKATKTLQEELGREPTPSEIQEKTKLNPEQQKKIKQIINETFISLSTPTNDDDTTIEDVIADENHLSSGEAAIKKDFKKKTPELISQIIKRAKLSKKEEDVLYKRHGIGDPEEDEKTLQGIADEYEVTRERIRQIEQGAYNKVQNKIGKDPLITELSTVFQNEPV
ncbi:MAG: hypothetical protein A2Y25_04965 [Candidatus Melainabacteria bacterium GWF2_37_15]|nr:MAG: hypothetical protein A2Y25_04965 [Candidatus Melainabacteria bacterium GWF2_37_15]